MTSVFQKDRREILSKQERLETASKHTQQIDMSLEAPSPDKSMSYRYGLKLVKMAI